MHDGSTLYQDWSVSVGRQIRVDKGALSAVIRHFVEAQSKRSRTRVEQVPNKCRSGLEQPSNKPRTACPEKGLDPPPPLPFCQLLD